mmetsp:Transcript_48533/g.103862  ORF Transcript_48533/g.103862 Transcript_48533/m.103862 type:complete len:246 (+) Transcript_48533:175-912(+)
MRNGGDIPAKPEMGTRPDPQANESTLAWSTGPYLRNTSQNQALSCGLASTTSSTQCFCHSSRSNVGKPPINNSRSTAARSLSPLRVPSARNTDLGMRSWKPSHRYASSCRMSPTSRCSTSRSRYSTLFSSVTLRSRPPGRSSSPSMAPSAGTPVKVRWSHKSASIAATPPGCNKALTLCSEKSASNNRTSRAVTRSCKACLKKIRVRHRSTGELDRSTTARNRPRPKSCRVASSVQAAPGRGTRV